MVSVAAVVFLDQSRPDGITYEISGTAPEPLLVTYTGSAASL